MKRRQHTPEEIANDNSLKYFDYKYMECLYSDTHKDDRRFVRYVDSGIELAEMSWKLTGEVVPILSVRRRSGFNLPPVD